MIHPSGKPSLFGDRLPEGAKGRNPSTSPLLPQATHLSPSGASSSGHFPGTSCAHHPSANQGTGVSYNSTTEKLPGVPLVKKLCCLQPTVPTSLSLIARRSGAAEKETNRRPMTAIHKHCFNTGKKKSCYLSNCTQ